MANAKAKTKIYTGKIHVIRTKIYIYIGYSIAASIWKKRRKKA